MIYYDYCLIFDVSDQICNLYVYIACNGGVPCFVFANPVKPTGTFVKRQASATKVGGP